MNVSLKCVTTIAVISMLAGCQSATMECNKPGQKLYNGRCCDASVKPCAGTSDGGNKTDRGNQGRAAY